MRSCLCFWLNFYFFSVVIILRIVEKYRHTKIKSLESVLSWKIFLIEKERKTPRVYYIHFVSKILFMIRLTFLNPLLFSCNDMRSFLMYIKVSLCGLPKRICTDEKLETIWYSNGITALIADPNKIKYP